MVLHNPTFPVKSLLLRRSSANSTTTTMIIVPRPHNLTVRLPHNSALALKSDPDPKYDKSRSNLRITSSVVLTISYLQRSGHSSSRKETDNAKILGNSGIADSRHRFTLAHHLSPPQGSIVLSFLHGIQRILQAKVVDMPAKFSPVPSAPLEVHVHWAQLRQLTRRCS